MKLTGHEFSPRYWRKQAERNGIKSGTYRMRLRRGWSRKDAATMPVTNKSPSTKAKCRAAGFTSDVIRWHRLHHPDSTLTDDEIIERAIERRDNSIKQRAIAAGLDPRAVYQRVSKQGWSLEQALSTPPMSPAEAGRLRHQTEKGKKR